MGSLPYYTAEDARPLTRVLKWEADPQFSRESVTVLGGDDAARELKVGTVIGAILFDDPVIAPAGGNVGNGAVTALSLGGLALLGAYVLTCTAEAANGGTFSVRAPDGTRLADAKVAQAYVSDHLSFTITDGGNDWDIGDKVTITVSEGSGKVVALDPEASDGSQVAHGVMATNTTAPVATDTAGVAIRRQALVDGTELLWPEDISDADKSAALARLAGNGVLTRTGV